MTKKETLKLFEDRKVRTLWDDQEEQWYFSIVDVVSVLTDSADPKQYIKKMKSRDECLKSNWGTICTLVPLDYIHKNEYQAVTNCFQLNIWRKC